MIKIKSEKILRLVYISNALFFSFVSSSALAETFIPNTSVSGQLLQNNPLLAPPAAPRTEKAESAIGRDIRPAPEKKSGQPTMHLKKIVIMDIPASAREDVETYLSSFDNKQMTFSALQKAAAGVSAILSLHGEKLSYAYIPDQTVQGGVVKFAIMQGHLESVRLGSNGSLVGSDHLQKFADALDARKGNISEVENYLLRITDLPGIGDFSSILTPGQHTGGSALTLNAAASQRVEGALVFDNAGSVSTGRNRLGGQVTLNSPLGLGDRLQTIGYISPDVIQIKDDSKKGKTFIARVSYDLPVDGRGTRLGAAWTHVNYKLVGPVLSGLGEGFAEVASLYGSTPIVRSNQKTITLGLNLEYKSMSDKFWGMDNHRYAPVISLPVSGDLRSDIGGRPNILQFAFTPGMGRLSNQDSWNGLETRGGFLKIGESLKFQQTLYPRISLGLDFNAQQASKNLDGAEKISLGGPGVVRAYSNSAVSADSGWIISPAINFSIPALNGLSTELFYDYAQGKVQKFSANDQRVAIAGYGIGVNYNLGKSVFVKVSYAWRDGHDDLLQPQNKAMGWVSAGLFF